MDIMSPPLFIAFILLMAVGAQWLAWRTHMPAIVMLAGVGVVLGPVLGVLEPETQLDGLLKYLVSLAVAVVLFDGGLSLRLDEIKETRKGIFRLVVLGGFLAWGLSTLAAHYVAGLSWPVAGLFGGILVVTGPTVITPMLRQAKLNLRISKVLKWEGIVIDPIGAMFAVIVFEFLTSSGVGISMSNNVFAGIIDLTLIIIGLTAASYLYGRVVAWLLRDDHLPEFLKGPFVLTALLVAYTLANTVLDEGGLIAVTVLGATLANAKISSLNDIRHVKEYLSIIMVSLLFILLTATLTWQELMALTWQDGVFLGLLILVVRPLSVWLSTEGTSLSMQERALLSFVAPRGVVLVAICGLFGPILVEAGYPDGARLIPLSFAVVFTTVLLYGFSVKPLAKFLGLTAKRTGGVLIVGSNPWSVSFAKELKQNNVPVLIAEKNWHRLRKARMADIPVYYGEIASSFAAHKMELNPYSKLVAATDNYAYNALVCSRFFHLFGRTNVFQLASDEQDKSDPEAYCHSLRGRTLMDESAHFEILQKRLSRGWHFSSASLTDPNAFDDLINQYGKDALFIAVVDRTQSLIFNTEDTSVKARLRPARGQKVILFAPPGRHQPLGFNKSGKQEEK